MAFDINAALGYGAGGLGDFVPASFTQVNAYARVTAVTTTSITIADKTLSDFGNFAVGEEILLQVVDVDSETYAKQVGAWRVLKISAVNGDVLTVTNDPTKCVDANNFEHYTCQAITLPHFRNMTLNAEISLVPMQYSGGRGGVVAFKCSGTLKFNGGHIDLTDMGLTSERQLTAIEKDQPGNGDAGEHAGWENYLTQKNFTLQRGDGAAFILAKSMTCHANSRIGNPNTLGVAYCRGIQSTATSTYRAVPAPEGFALWGGSSILIAAETISSFNVKMFAKYRAISGTNSSENHRRGQARCYIASETDLPVDEGLYAHDVISTPSRLSKSFNIKSFGDGSDGVATEVTSQINNYAKITEINDARTVLTYTGKTTDGAAKFKVGGLVMIHAMHKSTSYVEHSGRFILAKVVGFTATKITIDTPIPNLSNFNTTHYDFQVVTIPQYSSFTLASNTNSATPKYENGRGGIFAIAVSGTCELYRDGTTQGGTISVAGKGGGEAYGRQGLQYISNAGMATRLPLGQGNGSIFILAQTLSMRGASLGTSPASYGGGIRSGEGHGGLVVQTKNAVNDWAGGYYGHDFMASSSANTKYGSSGYGGAGGTNTAGKHNGGYGSNSSDGAYQGAHIMIVANKIIHFNIAAICTGGANGTAGTPAITTNQYYAGASYGGGGKLTNKPAANGATGFKAYGGAGGFVGGGAGSGDEDSWGSGGGSGGFCFVYCNEETEQVTTEICL